MQLLPDLIPTSPHLMAKLSDLWQAASCQNHIIANNPERSHELRHISRAHTNHNRPAAAQHLQQLAGACQGRLHTVSETSCPQQPDL